MNIIPAIDLKEGRCVRLVQGDFDQVTEYSNDPAALAQKIENMGFDYLHVVDLDGARVGTQKNQQSIQAICEASSMSVQLGGGIREAATLEKWFNLGIKRCVVGSVAVTTPELVKDWLQSFGADRIVLALDVNIDSGGTPQLATHGWTQTTTISLWDCIEFYIENGLEHVLCTDIGRDGALSGPNFSLYRDFMQRYPMLGLQVSGGVRHIQDLKNAALTGAAAAITGRALLDGRISPQEIASFQQNA